MPYNYTVRYKQFVRLNLINFDSWKDQYLLIEVVRDHLGKRKMTNGGKILIGRHRQKDLPEVLVLGRVQDMPTSVLVRGN